MTCNEFIQNLITKLDFLSEEEKQLCASYLDGRLSEFSGEALPIAFEPFSEVFQEEIKALYSREDFTLSATLPLAFDKATKTASGDELGDVIFSKPLSAEKAPEVIHSMENKEVKTLYGEKVMVAQHSLDEEETPEPIDEMNGLTDEEIRSAKEQTLEKTEHFDSDMENTASQKKYFLEEEENAPVEEEEETVETEEKPMKEYQGLAKKILGKNENKKGMLTLAYVLVSPLFLLAAAAALLVYLTAGVLILLASLALFLCMILVVTAGVVELVYGFLILFENIPAALIELGFGTMLIAVVTAITALIYEFIFNQVPKWLKWLLSSFLGQIKRMIAYLYGGRA